jgi:hypothetical protein
VALVRETCAPPYVVRALLTGVGLVVGVGLLVTGSVRCPTALLLGVPCPSCGTTRAARALLDLDVARAFRIHPVAPFVLAVLSVLAARIVGLVWREGHARALLEGKLGRWLAFTLVGLAGAEVMVWGLRWCGLFGGPVPV